MADEIQTLLSVRIEKGSFLKQIGRGQLSYDLASTLSASGVANVGTSEEDLSFGDIATLGFAYFCNLDEDNYVTFGPKSGGSMVAFGRIYPGEEIWLRLNPGITLRWIADTANVLVQYEIFST